MKHGQFSRNRQQIEELQIPYRAITISDGDGGDKQFHVYDTTGPYTDPSYNINLDSGLPKGRDQYTYHF